MGSSRRNKSGKSGKPRIKNAVRIHRRETTGPDLQENSTDLSSLPSHRLRAVAAVKVSGSPSRRLPADYNTGGPLSCCFRLPHVITHCCETPRERKREQKLPEARIQEPPCLSTCDSCLGAAKGLLTRWLMHFSRFFQMNCRITVYRTLSTPFGMWDKGAIPYIN